MFPVSDKYKIAIRDTCTFEISGTLLLADGTVQSIDDSNLITGSLAIKKSCLPGSVLEFGGAVLGELTFSIRSQKSQYIYLDGIISLGVSVRFEDEQEIIPLGVWVIAETKKTLDTINITAYDMVFKLEKPYPGISLTGTPFSIMTLVAQTCGVELGQTADEFEQLPNGDMPITFDTDSGLKSYREIVGSLAQMCGGFVTADRYGKIVIKQVHINTDFELTLSQRYSSNIADFTCSYDCIRISGNAGEFSSGEHFETPGTLIMTINDARGWDYGSEEILQQKTNNLFYYVDVIEYTPSKVSLFSDPAIDCGDRYKLYTKDGYVSCIVTNYTWRYNGRMDIEGVGQNPYLTSAATQSSTSRGGGGSSQSSQMFYYLFTNGSAARLSSFSETDLLELANVTITTTKDTTAEFHGIIQLDSTVVNDTVHFMAYDSSGDELKDFYIKNNAVGTLLIQYRLNDNIINTVLYKNDVLSGNTMLSLYYPVTGLLRDVVYRFSVYAGFLNGFCDIEVGNFLGTISGQGVLQSKAWDGILKLTDDVHTLAMPTITELHMTDSVVVNKVTVNPKSEISEQAPLITLPEIEIPVVTGILEIEQET